MKLDYSPLNEKFAKPIRSELTDIPKLSNKIGSLFLTVFVVSIIFVLSKELIITLLLFPLIFTLLYWIVTNSNSSAIRLSNFAVKNGFTYMWGRKENNSDIIKVNLSGVIGSKHGEVSASNVITGRYKDFSFTLFNPYLKGFYTVMKVDLANRYPHIVFDSQANNPLISNIGHFFSEDARIHLEGDFDDYFRVYSKAPATDSLRILTPDMMALMIDSGHKYDIEIFEDKLHIISNYKFSNEQNARYFFELADTLLDKLDRRAVTKQATFDYTSTVE